MEKFSRFFCGECGKWLGTKESNASMKGIFPYCPRCRRQVTPSETKPVYFKKNTSAKCQQD